MDIREGDDKIVAAWAADCAGRALPYFEEAQPDDPDPKEALDALRAWIDDDVSVARVRIAAFGAHGAARMVPARSAAQFAARAVARACGAAYAIDDARAVGAYARKAAEAAEGEEAAEREADLQRKALSKRLHPLVFREE